jgi:ferritin
VKELNGAINQHLAAEFQSSHSYLAMSIRLREKDLAGFSTTMHDKSQVKLSTIGAPERSWPSVQTLFDQAHAMSESVAERSATAMLDWFMAEQPQEEAEARFVRKRLRLAGNNSAALLLLDQQFLEGTDLSHIKGCLSGARGGLSGR